MPRLNKRLARHTGGGSWDEYCYCCGLPFSVGLNEDDVYLSDGSKATAAQQKTIAEKAKSIEKVASWLKSNVGLDSTNNVIFELGGGFDMGEMMMNKVQPYPGAQEIYDAGGHIFVGGELAYMGNDNDEPKGLAIHKDCAAVIEKAIGRTLKPSDEKLLREFQKPGDETRDDGPCFNKYNQQFYEWTDAALNEPVSFFASPAVDATQRERILACNSKFIAAASSKKGGRRATARNKRSKGTRRNGGRRV